MLPQPIEYLFLGTAITLIVGLELIIYPSNSTLHGSSSLLETMFATVIFAAKLMRGH